MGGGKTDTLDAVDFGDHADKFGKAWLIGYIQAVGIDILAQQHNLFHAIVCQSPNLVEHLGRTSTDLPAAHERDDAVGTIIIAALHNSDKPAEATAVMPFRKQVKALIIINKGGLASALAVFSSNHHFRQQVQIVGPKHQIHPGEPVQQRIPLMLGNTAADPDN